MNDFERLMQKNLSPLLRYVRFKIGDPYDAEDVTQEVCLAATLEFDKLKNQAAFKAWLIGIARNKCKDYYRKKARTMDIPLDSLSESVFATGRLGIVEQNAVRDTLNLIGDKEKQILYLYYFKQLSQEEISKRLSVPLGTVKSRLHYAKEKFKRRYPQNNTPKGEDRMKKLPESMPVYTIKASELPPFSVKWEELQGWLLVPRLGEKLTWGLYDMPSRKRTEYTEMQVIGKAEVHGIEGVEISALQYDAEDYYRTESVSRTERRFIAQLTDTHCRYLAESHVEHGVRKLYTFLDGDAFLDNWGFGEDNVGKEVNLTAKISCTVKQAL